MRYSYEQLRDSTRQTTIEVMDQARDYASEFYRLRRCLLPSARIPFTYVVPPGEEPREVLLVGDFTQWREHPIAMMRSKNMFVASVLLPAGDYLYKSIWMGCVRRRFIVDGQWRVSAKTEVFKDDGYNYHHAITVPKSTNTAGSRVISRLWSVCLRVIPKQRSNQVNLVCHQQLHYAICFVGAVVLALVQPRLQVFEELVTKVLESPSLMESMGVVIPKVDVSAQQEEGYGCYC